MQLRRVAEVEAHAQDQPATGFALEQAVAVGELAVIQAELAQLAGFAIQRGEPGEYVLQLDAVGTDVLHGRGADGAGNQAEVFQAAQPLLQTPEHQGMPGLSRLGFQQHIDPVIAEDADAAAGHAQHQCIDVAGQQQVAAAAYGQQRQTTLDCQGQGFPHLVIVAGFGEQPRLHVDPKGVVGLEGKILVQDQAHRRPFISRISASQACSTRSSTASKPSSPP
ncbi:hypothetical protein D3C72_1575800 [compost metagenome]